MTLMFQKEVAQKILPNDPHNAMGSLHALALSQFELKHVAYVPPGAFVPPPKIDSQVLSFERKASPIIPLDQIDRFETFLRGIFGQRRKQLGGIMKNEWGDEITQKKLRATAVDPKIRAEALTFNEIINLYLA